MVKQLKTLMQPPVFSSEEDNQVARILFRILYTLPVFYLVFITNRMLAGEFNEVLIMSIGCVVLIGAFVLLIRKRLRPAVFISSLIVLAQTTALATAGQGIRDLAVVCFPIIIILMTLILNKRYFLIMTSLTLACISWITLGAALKWYHPKPAPPPSYLDFIIATGLIVLTSLIAYLLADNMRNNLAKARAEIENRKRMSKVIEDALHEKEILLRELHHRVKNNLAVINSLLNLQQEHIDDREDALKAFGNMRTRIISMSLVHEQLYKSENYACIHMDQYIQSMTRNLKSIFLPEKRVDIDISTENIDLTIDIAIPCGMIINEIVTNALKHAFQGVDSPRILIVLEKSDNRFRLSIADNGTGMPEPPGSGKPGSMGLRLVNLLTTQLSGKKEVFTDQGTRYEITFPAGVTKKAGRVQT